MDHPCVVDGLCVDERPCVGELGSCGREEGANLVRAAEVALLVVNRGVGRERRERNFGVTSVVGVQVSADDLRNLDTVPIVHMRSSDRT